MASHSILEMLGRIEPQQAALWQTSKPLRDYLKALTAYTIMNRTQIMLLAVNLPEAPRMSAEGFAEAVKEATRFWLEELERVGLVEKTGNEVG